MIQKNGDIMNLSAAEFQPVFPIETDYSELPVNNDLRELEFSQILSEKILTFEVIVPDDLHEIHIICFINDKKYDLFFNVSGGKYMFSVTKISSLKKVSILYFNRIVRSREQVLYLA